MLFFLEWFSALSRNRLLSARGFWLDRRYPIVNAWREKG